MLCSKLAWQAVWQRKEQFVNFLFSCACKKTGSDHPDSEENMLKFLFALQQSKGAHWQPTALQSGGTSPRGVKPNWGASLMDNRVGESPWCKALQLCILTGL